MQGRFSPLGLGCASAWGQNWFDEGVAISIVNAALDLGVTVFDTGASYSNGHAEPRLGKALKGKALDRLLISTKTGTHISPSGRLYKDWSRKAIFPQLERSRKNLGMDTLPLVYLHGPRKADLTVELLDTLSEARHRKWVRLLGVNTFDNDVLEALPEMRAIDVVMLDYNLMRIDRELIIDKLHAAGKTVVGGAALANQMHAPQFLIPKNRADIWYLLRALKGYRRQYLRARRLKFLKDVPGWSPAQIAIAFATSNKKISTSMFSTTRLEHLKDNVEASSRRLPDVVSLAIRDAMTA